MKRTLINSFFLVYILFSLLCPTFSYAGGSLQLSPLRLSLSESTSVTTLTVRNRSTTPSLLQVELLSWKQKDGVDYFEPTRDILISPPVFTVAPNGEQILRAVIRRKPHAKDELTYRLFVQEVQDKSRPVDSGSINVLLNISIPVFIQPAITPKQQLVWSAQTMADNKVILKLANTGSNHIQVKSFELKATNDLMIAENSMRYVLPNTSTEWTLNSHPKDFKSLLNTNNLQINAKTDNGDLLETVSLEHR